MEIKRSDAEGSQSFGASIREDPKNRLVLQLHYRNGNIYPVTIEFHGSNIYFNRILNKWNKICMSLDFLRQEGQVAFNGHLSDKVLNVHTFNLDHKINNETNTPKMTMTMSIASFFYDRDPLIGKMANINMWNRTMHCNGFRRIN